MFVEAEADDQSEGGLSRSSSLRSNSSVTAKVSRRNASRSKTRYSLAVPAPVGVKTKLSFRPKLLLQMQRTSLSSRPVPTYDVLPSTSFAPRLARKFPKVFRGKDGLGANDVVVVSSEEYTHSQSLEPVSEETGEDGWHSREVVASICQLGRSEGRAQGKAEICINDGSRWEASPLSNGCYEFVSIDEHGISTTVRWVTRSSKTHRRNSLSTGSGRASEDERKFNFSVINPSFRRHPIIASLSKHSLDILDSYPTTSSSTANHPPTSPFRRPSRSDSFPEDRSLTPTSPSLHLLIAITSIWVSLRESWVPTFTYTDLHTRPPLSPLCPQAHQPRTSSLPSPPSSRPASPTRSATASKLLRTINRSSPPRHPSPPVSPAEGPATRARRANSTGTQFMARRASSGWRPTTTQQPAVGQVPLQARRASVRGVSKEGLPGWWEEEGGDEGKGKRRPTSWAPGVGVRGVVEPIGEKLIGEMERTENNPMVRNGVVKEQRRRKTQSEYFDGPSSTPDREPGTPVVEDKGRKRFSKLRSLLGVLKRHGPAS
ncbi:MAG: hypothetical protein M1814_001402 [Vezdaea aestivalis]|nr:MAG: hypothetical protein M1814_001402 [Vezdaea aestivalis]